MKKFCKAALMLGLSCSAGPAFAGERQASNYPHGAENWGTGALPPPGTYLLNYTNYTTYDRLNDDRGKSIVPNFKADAYADVVRVVEVTKRRLFGASYGFQVIAPVVDLTVHAAGARSHTTSVGDVVVDPLILGWHFNDLHVTSGLDIFLPTGSFRRSRLANVGRNYVSIEPVVALSYLPKNGLDASVKLMYDINTVNRSTNYRSGQEFHLDYLLGKTFRNGLGIGVAGYLIHQTTDDHVSDRADVVNGNRGRAFAIGPTARYPIGRILLIGVWQHETAAENRPQGDKFWLRVVARL